ncbi:MAG TPA: elongation factor G, partial [Candidatus Ozemobacteraceae bacterium]|nr:elongation factor G [Candidatus Ozemobacteraceae bacterium]
MKIYAPESIRNIGLMSHGGAGKTSLAEAILFHTGANSRIGKVDDGSTMLNYDPEEVRRKISIGVSLAAIEWKNTKINLLDAPGFDDFLGEVWKIVPAMDAAIVVVNAGSGIEVGTEKNWKILNTHNIPRIVYLSKLDKENINVQKIIDDLKAFDSKITPIQIPLGTHANLKGVIDVLEMKAYFYQDDQGKKFEVKDIPAEYKDMAAKLREAAVESIVECDDDLMNKFFEVGADGIAKDELHRALKTGLAQNKIKPLLCGMALKNLGTDQLLDFIINCMPSPVERGAIEALTANGEKKMIEPKADGPAVGFIFKKASDQAGEMLFMRGVSGKFSGGTEYFNTNKDNTERLANFSTLRGKTKIELDGLGAGDIAIIVKPKITTRGDTLCEKAQQVKIVIPALPEPRLTYAVNPRTKQDQERMGTGLQTLCGDDGILKYEFDPELGQGLISGLGDTHIDVAICRLKLRWNVEVDIGKPRIPYRETIKGTADVQGKHKKQSGGRGQFGDVTIKFEPCPDKEFEFVDAIVGGVVPRNF